MIRNAQIIELNELRDQLIQSRREDRLAKKAPFEIQEEARAEYIAAKFALNELEKECIKVEGEIAQFTKKRIALTARKYLERNNELLIAGKEQLDRAHNRAKAAREDWDMWRRQHAIQADLPPILLFGMGAELHRRVKESEVVLSDSEGAFQITQGEVLDPQKLKVLTAKIKAYNKPIDEKLDELRSSITIIEPAMAAVQERAKVATVAWEPYRRARKFAVDGVPELHVFNMPSTQRKPVSFISSIPRSSIGEGDFEP